MRPRLPAAEAVAPYLRRMDLSGIYSNSGPLVRELEAAYAEFLGVDARCCVAAANATLAIQGALEVLGRECWVAPTYTFAATGHAVLAAGAKLVLADVSKADWALDLTGTVITDDVGILAVAPFGSPVSLSRWQEHASVVIDAAASLGASRGRLRGLQPGWAACFSLHATKVLPAGEGGLAVFGSESDADAFRRWTNFAFDAQRISAYRATNAKMSEIHAAYALASYASWAVEEQEWLAPLSHALAASNDLEVSNPIVELPGARPYWIAEFSSRPVRESVEAVLAAAGIETRRWWPALLSDMPAFRGSDTADYPVARNLCDVTLGLPMYRSMGESEFRIIVEALQEALEAVPEGLNR